MRAETEERGKVETSIESKSHRKNEGPAARTVESSNRRKGIGDLLGRIRKKKGKDGIFFETKATV